MPRHVLRTAIDARGDANVMLATGNSQLVFLAHLVDDARRRLVTRRRVPHGRVRRSRCRPSGELPALHARARRRSGSRLREFHYLDGDTGDPERRSGTRYAALLHAHPLDLVLLRDRRERPPRVQRPARRRLRRPARRQGRRARRCFAPPAGRRRPLRRRSTTCPTHAITVTIPALFAGRRVLAIVPESRKAAAVRAAVEGPISTACPASILRTQPHATLYLDRESAALLSRSIRPALGRTRSTSPRR